MDEDDENEEYELPLQDGDAGDYGGDYGGEGGESEEGGEGDDVSVDGDDSGSHNESTASWDGGVPVEDTPEIPIEDVKAETEEYEPEKRDMKAYWKRFVVPKFRENLCLPPLESAPPAKSPIEEVPGNKGESESEGKGASVKGSNDGDSDDGSMAASEGDPCFYSLI